MMLKRFINGLALALMTGVVAVTVPLEAVAQDKDAPTVALSNAFVGNAWRRSMITAFEEAATKAQADGLIAGFKVANAPGENSAPAQIAQLKELLLEEPDILLVNPASPTALNPTLQKACDQGAVVVVFDSATDLECAYLVTNSFADWARLSTNAVIEGMGGKGNVVLARGVQGSPPEAEMYAVQSEILAEYPEVNVVGEFFSFCDSGKAQEALLGIIETLPEVHGVIGCGEGFGAVEAFKAMGLPAPVVAFAPSGLALKDWAAGAGAPGSVAVMSDPGQSVAAMFAGIDVYQGITVPRVTIFPPVVVAEADRDAWIAAVDDDQIASWQWTKDLVDAQIQANIDGTVAEAALPSVPVR
jgi:ribose transport system substrate-binding protein